MAVIMKEALVDYHEFSDWELVKQAETDPQAISRLYEKHINRIYNYIFQRTGNIPVAEDLTAIVMTKVLLGTRSGRYKPKGKARFSDILYQSAHNIVVNHYRDRQKRKTVRLDILAVKGLRAKLTIPDRNPEKIVIANEENEALRQVIRQLPPDRQQVLILKYGGGLTNPQIGEIMHRTEGSIKSLSHRTLVQLRRICKKE